MTKKTVRVFIGDARLSYPALDEPKPAMAGSDDLKYQATFLLDPSNPTVETVRKAIWEVACAAWGDRAQAMLQHPDKCPLRRGDDKEKVPDGYHGMLYINARSKNRPELRDANPINLVISQEEIRQKFVAGYRVNAFVDIYAYEVRGGTGSVIKSGIAAGLISVQFKAYADPFSGSAPAHGGPGGGLSSCCRVRCPCGGGTAPARSCGGSCGLSSCRVRCPCCCGTCAACPG